MKLKLDLAFLDTTGVALDADDLVLGVSRELIPPAVAVACALRAVENGSQSATMLEVAQLGPDDPKAITDILAATDPDDLEVFADSAIRKWVYLQLKAVYEIRSTIRDPFAAVEMIYADFGYPPSIAPFVRYMPAPDGADTGDQALFNAWARYLEREETYLLRRS